MTSGGATLVLPSTTSRSAGNSPGVTKPAGASPLVPSCRSAFSVTGRGLGPTSPYSDSAAVDHPQRITSVKQMAQLFEDASLWHRDIRRHHRQFGVEVLKQSRQFAVERQNFAVNSELFFFPTSSQSAAATTTTSAVTTTTTTTSKSVSNYNATVVSDHRSTIQRRENLRLDASGSRCVRRFSAVHASITVHHGCCTQCQNCEILTGGQVARRRRRQGGGAWGGVFPPVNMVIANPHDAKRKLGVKDNWGLTPTSPSPDNSHPGCTYIQREGCYDRWLEYCHTYRLLMK